MSRFLPGRATSGGAAQVRAAEALPGGERLRVPQSPRAAAIGLLLLCAALAPQALAPGRRQAVLTTLVYAGIVVVGECLSRILRERVVVLFSALLMIDGLWLAWASYVTGSLSSPVRYLVLLHLGAVALLASYRTGLKLALWHSLLLLAVYNGQQQPGGWLTPTEPAGLNDLLESAQTRLAVFVVVLWLVAVSTSALSAVNERELRRRRMDLEALTDLAESL